MKGDLSCSGCDNVLLPPLKIGVSSDDQKVKDDLSRSGCDNVLLPPLKIGVSSNVEE